MAGTPSVFVQIWVDNNALTNGQTKGVYVLDNRVSSGSTSEATASLTTSLSNGSYINWQVLNIDPTDTETLSIQSISNSNAWGSTGQPESDSTYGGFTGQVQNTGTAPYSVTFNSSRGGGITTTVNLQIKAS